MITVKDLENVGNGFTAMVYCDNASDLTDVPTVISDYRLVLGSHIFVVDTNKAYSIKSDGTYVEM